MTISLAKIKDNHIDTHTHTKSPLYQASVTSFRKKRGGGKEKNPLVVIEAERNVVVVVVVESAM